MLEELMRVVYLKIRHEFTELGNLTKQGDNLEENHLQTHSGPVSKASK